MSDPIIPSTIVCTINKGAVRWDVHEISTRHASALYIKVDMPYVVTQSQATGQRWTFASAYEAIDFILGDNKRPIPTWDDDDLVSVLMDSCSDHGDLDSINAINRIIRMLVGNGKVWVCEHNHIQPGEHPLENEHIPCSFCTFEDGEQADAMHNARTEVNDQPEQYMNEGYDVSDRW